MKTFEEVHELVKEAMRKQHVATYYDESSKVTSYADEIARFLVADVRPAGSATHAEVFQMLVSAMSKQDAATYFGDQSDMEKVALETAKKIALRLQLI